VLVVLVLMALGGAHLYGIASEPPGPMKEEEFARAVRQVASLARETAFLCARIEDDQLTGPFARTHREKLEEEVRDQAEALQAAVPPALEAAAVEARELTANLMAGLRELKVDLAKPAALANVREESQRIGRAMDRLETR
jgi:hypothetical protein